MTGNPGSASATNADVYPELVEGANTASPTPPAIMDRFRYTGQVWLPELGLYYYKARMYSSTLGRFMQTDPIGYADGMNVYAYVGNDPVNGVDPTGLAGFDGDEDPPIVVTGDPLDPCDLSSVICRDEDDFFDLRNGPSFPIIPTITPIDFDLNEVVDEIVVTACRASQFG